MGRYKNFRHFFETSDWKSWLAGGIVAIALVTFIQDTVIEHRVKQAQQAVMASIDREEQAIRHAREDAEQRDQKVDAAFDRAMQSSSNVIDSGENTMGKVRHSMAMDKEQ